ncbi:hypothetical protein H1S01_15620 [Heliobacterium chlorum]|uniref:Bro-N domain-containing protein n=1 Tax=Heliobacterium chlorum TaxID=2698 RepID=A0ABR7T544_HELCL|nr:BRO family protein [Heliobacterium chlorum]MBC9785914.1 hypothetical protein [Heliobacterium chlorum]
MQQLEKVFNYNGNQIRTMILENEPWWVAKDVCDVLEVKNSRDALRRLDDDEKDDVGISDAIGRTQRTTVINEPGLYRLVLGSRKPEAKDFKRWVVHDLLPTLRKTGSYSMKTEATAGIEPSVVVSIVDKACGMAIGGMKELLREFRQEQEKRDATFKTVMTEIVHKVYSDKLQQKSHSTDKLPGFDTLNERVVALSQVDENVLKGAVKRLASFSGNGQQNFINGYLTMKDVTGYDAFAEWRTLPIQQKKEWGSKLGMVTKRGQLPKLAAIMEIVAGKMIAA